MTIIYDSGIRTGSNIIKAIALDAQTVLIDRPFVYELALGGEEGGDAIIRSVLADLEISLALVGYKSIDKRGASGEQGSTSSFANCEDGIGFDRAAKNLYLNLCYEANMPIVYIKGDQCGKTSV